MSGWGGPCRIGAATRVRNSSSVSEAGNPEASTVRANSLRCPGGNWLSCSVTAAGPPSYRAERFEGVEDVLHVPARAGAQALQDEGADVIQVEAGLDPCQTDSVSRGTGTGSSML